jgi:SWIM zinc finger
MNTINRTPAITFPEGMTESHRARIEVKALHVPSRYTFSEFRTDDDQPTGKFALVPSTEKDFAINPYGYEVDLPAQTCTCPGFQESGVCSHLLAVADFVALGAWADEMDASMGDFYDSEAGRTADLAERAAA